MIYNTGNRSNDTTKNLFTTKDLFNAHAGGK